jgi:signal transduction histidine kinase
VHGRRHRITTRVLALSAAVAVLLGAVLVVLVIAVTAQHNATDAAIGSQETLTAGSELEKSLVTIENGLRGFVASGRTRFLEPAERALEDYPAQLERLRDSAAPEAEQRAAVERLSESIEDYVGLWARPLISLANDRLPAARSVLLTRGGRERLDAIAADFAGIFERERRLARERTQRARDQADLAIGLGIGGLAFVLAVAAGLAVFLRRTVVRPVLDLAEATERLAEGDLSRRVAQERPDELGDLARSFNAMADSLQRSQDELRRTNDELEQFASVTSHDLQAPLVTISMYAGLLERADPHDDAQRRRLVDAIRRATEQGRALIRDLLDFARTGRDAPLTEDVVARDALSQALETMAGDVLEAGATITIGDLPVVLAERTGLTRVFQNLIGNAIKFAAPDRHPDVHIGADPDGAQWRIWVRDNGIGMTEADASRVFGPFERVHGEEEFPGTGIGLAVCDRIVAQHGGRMGVTTRLGEGSEFWFTLPAGTRRMRAERPVRVPA